MSLTRRRRIISAFGNARAYDANAAAQAAIAARLARMVPDDALPPGAFVLDMGCGTGALAELLLTRRHIARYLCADIAPGMLARARSRLRPHGARVLFAAMDAAQTATAQRFHLAVSSMALHWAADLSQALRGLWLSLVPGGVLAVALPAQGTFLAWREAHDALGLPCGLQEFPSREALAAALPAHASIRTETFPLLAARAIDLPRHLKSVGAFVPRPGHAPLPPGHFRTVLRTLDKSLRLGASLDYRVHFVLAVKAAS